MIVFAPGIARIQMIRTTIESETLYLFADPFQSCIDVIVTFIGTPVIEQIVFLNTTIERRI